MPIGPSAAITRDPVLVDLLQGGARMGVHLGCSIVCLRTGNRGISALLAP
jgi:hypothetical protein